MKKIIITADDFGYLECIDSAIIELVAENKVMTVSAFGNVKTSVLKAKIERLLHANPNVCVGVHLTISSHESVLQVPTSFTKKIDRQETFLPTRQINFNKILREPKVLKAELQAQINNLQKSLGARPVDHLSCHHNLFYFNSKLFKIYVELAKENNLAIRSPQSCATLPQFKALKKIEPIIPAIAVEGFRTFSFRHLYAIMRSLRRSVIETQQTFLRSMQVQFPDYLMVNLYGNPSLNIVKTTYDQMIDEEVCEQIVHVGFLNSQNEVVPNGINAKYFSGRVKEFELLKSKEYEQILIENGLSIGSYRSFLLTKERVKNNI